MGAPISRRRSGTSSHASASLLVLYFTPPTLNSLSSGRSFAVATFGVRIYSKPMASCDGRAEITLWVRRPSRACYLLRGCPCCPAVAAHACRRLAAAACAAASAAPVRLWGCSLPCVAGVLVLERVGERTLQRI